MLTSAALIFSLLIIAILFSPSSSISDDISALLEFKSSTSSTAGSGAADYLASWVDSGDPCRDTWPGVTCNGRTHRVTHLVLENLNISSDLRPLSQLTELRVLSFNGNRLSSLSSVNFSSWPNLKQLYLSHNRFNGGFPTGICHLRRLLRVDLSYNEFSGEVPVAALGRLTRLLTLRLEGNSFTGNLPSARSLTSLVDFNVSGNHLSGPIPAWLSRFPAAAFTGNKNLCGKPLPTNCTIPIAVTGARLPRPKRNHSGDHVKILLFVAVDAVAVLAAAAAVGWCCYRNKKRRLTDDKMSSGSRGSFACVPLGVTASDVAGGGGSGRRGGGGEGEMVMFEGCKGFNGVDDLLKSSADLLGKGRAGTTYKVVVDGGGVVVVKRVRRRMRRKREVDGLLMQIGQLRHQNLVSLKAYHHSNDELLLVYDYLPNAASLHSLLHENRGLGRTPVTWATRIKLASDAASALTFLHRHHTQPKLYHGHVTSSNIITTDDTHGGAALISDTALSLLFPPSSDQEPNQAPELHVSSSKYIYTQKCDVYSFGVVLLEILTGKTAADGGGGGEGTETGLVRWVRHVAGGEWSAKEVFDFELMAGEAAGVVEVEEMKAVLQVALACLAPSPADRPTMREVRNVIDGVRNKKKNIIIIGGSSGGGVNNNKANIINNFKMNDEHESSSSSSF